MKNPIMYRQGDVILIATEGTNQDVEAAPKDPRGLVLAEGETSGHHHAVFGSGAKLFRFRDASGQQLLVTGKKGADIRVIGGGAGGVPRHEPISIRPGTYLVRVQRAFTSAMRSRQVSD